MLAQLYRSGSSEKYQGGSGGTEWSRQGGRRISRFYQDACGTFSQHAVLTLFLSALTGWLKKFAHVFIP
ncbi:hypothetical protein [Aeromonas sp. s3]|uniref:hypothetical protein n=1 Tax=Aeromonas sp. s3 TaxID=3138485 RepID=UPI0034A45867